MKLKKVAVVTGYKPHELMIFHHDHPAIKYIKKAIEQELRQLLEECLEWVLISGQLGVELWVAQVVFELKREYDLKLAILTPFLNQDERWNEANKQLYAEITVKADFVEALSKRPYRSPQQFRNKDQFFLHKSDCAVIIYDDERGGHPKYFFQHAKAFQEQNEYEIIDFYTLQIIVEEEQIDYN